MRQGYQPEPSDKPLGAPPRAGSSAVHRGAEGLRDQIAMETLKAFFTRGLLEGFAEGKADMSAVARCCYSVADEMIAARVGRDG